MFLSFSSFVIAAVSPAVVVPSMLLLQDKGYGVRKGIPTLTVASASCENVYAISAHGIVLGISFSTGTRLSTIMFVYFIIFFYSLGYLPVKSNLATKRGDIDTLID